MSIKIFLKNKWHGMRYQTARIEDTERKGDMNGYGAYLQVGQ
jgi:hypothetical protein